MEIKHIKHWSKVVQNENVDHVTISYTDNGSDVTKHEFGNNSTAAPEFYVGFENLSPFVCKICSLDKKYQSAVSVREVKIAKSEDSDGDDNTTYALTCGFKAGHATVVFKVQVNHKYVPEKFDDAINTLVNEAEEYLTGKRAQTELDLTGSSDSDDQPEIDPQEPDDIGFEEDEKEGELIA